METGECGNRELLVEDSGCNSRTIKYHANVLTKYDEIKVIFTDKWRNLLFPKSLNDSTVVGDGSIHRL